MLTQERLKELLYYNPQFGIFVWINDRARGLKGSIAGRVNNGGYTQIGIDSKRYNAHRLVFLYIDGKFPENEVDHINHKRSDNRLLNLRKATKTENSKNRVLSKSNKSGFHGIFFIEKIGRWKVDISINGERKTIGSFKCKEDAIRARKNAEIIHGYHKNHGELSC